MYSLAATETAADRLLNPVTPFALQPEFLPVDDAFAVTARLENSSLILRWRVEPGYFLYRHALSVVPSGETQVRSPLIPAGLGKTDEYFGDVEVYYDELTLDVPVVSSSGQIKVQVGYQGCADAGLCYPPQTRHFLIEETQPGVYFPIEPGSNGLP